MSETCISVAGLKKHYPYRGKGVVKAVDGVDMEISRGEIMGVVGESGCGKSSLGKCMMRLTDITSGSIMFEGSDLSTLPRRQLLPQLRRMQMIFQNPFSSFNPKLKVGYSVREACRLSGMQKSETETRIDDLLEHISLTRDELDRFPHELSGGQLQRLAIARALLLDPAFIVADEPVSALDVSVQAQILNLIMDLRSVFSVTMLFISHDLAVVEHICDNVAVMYLGVVVEAGPARAVFAGLRHPYSQALMSSVPVIDGEGGRKPRIVLTGDIPTAVDVPQGCRFSSRCFCAADICRHDQPSLKDIGGGHKVACHLC